MAPRHPAISLARARAHWHVRAGLHRPVSGAPDDVVARTGWLRTLGGVDVYLAARARVPGLSRTALDRLVEDSHLRVIPAVRGCIYLVPSLHVPLALRVAEEAWRKSTDRELPKAGTSWKEVEEVGRAVAQVLARGPASTDAIRKALPPGTVRSLGEQGKKIGLSSPLPVALRDLEFKGAIERTLDGGRLDTERYVWRTTSADAGWGAPHVPDDAVERWAELARIFVAHAGPVSTAHFASWAGLGVRDARTAIEKAGLGAVAVTDYADEAWVTDEDAAALARPADAPSESVRFLSFEDNFFISHGGPRAVVEPAHWSFPVKPWGSIKGGTLGDVTHLLTRTLTVGDHIAGLWEMDPDLKQVLFATFAPVSRAAREAIDKLASETAAFLVEMGHAHSFTLDTDESVRERAAEVARVAGGGAKEKPRKKPAAAAAKRKKPAAAAAKKKKPAAAAKKKKKPKR